MFTVSYKWIVEIFGKNVEFDEIVRALDSQGFEVKSIENVKDDHLITIEVKANRPDMLSHFGVARELAAFLKINLDEPVFNLEIDEFDKDNFSVKLDESVCDCYHAICLDGINNTVETPDYIRERLEIFGMESINAAVDISNYTVLEFGQPTHIYDRDKLSGNCLNVYKNEKKCDFIDLFGNKLKLDSGDIVIEDSKKQLCIAGIIGSLNCETRKATKNVVIESAVFSQVPIRMTSKRLKISTLSSYRLERGVDCENSENVLMLIVQRILKTCGGHVVHKFGYRSSRKIDNKINLRVDRTNCILGTDLQTEEIVSCLRQYKFNCNVENENNISVNVPSFRLDVQKEIDVIEEVARGIGYDNILQKNLEIPLVYRKNKLYEIVDSIRNLLIGFGFNEVINYSFIPERVCNIIDLDKNKCVFIQNPLGEYYSLMRPNMVFSLLSSLSYNYSIGNYNVALFEIGRTYHLNKNSETLSDEINSLGFIISGNRIESGFGIVKPIKYDFYDLSSYINNIFSSFNQKITFSKNESACMKNFYNISSNGETIGFLGEVEASKFLRVLPNVKLVNDRIFYCEIDIDKIFFRKKSVVFESKYPSIIRQYNLICNKNVSCKEICDYIDGIDVSVRGVVIKDVYEDLKLNSELHSVLFEIRFQLEDRTMTNEEIESLEKKMLKELQDKFNISIKQK